MTFSNRFHDHLGAREDLLGGVNSFEVTIVGVVGPNQEHHYFGRLLEVEFAVLQIPENLFGPITIMPEIDSICLLYTSDAADE